MDKYDEFRKNLKYEDLYNEQNRRNDGYNRNQENKREIRGRSTRKSQRYRARVALRNKIIALALAGTTILGVGGTIAKGAMDAHEEKYVSSIEEMEKYNIDAQDLQISPESYEQVIKLNEEINNHNENNFKGVSDSELADYYQEMSDLYLKLLKEKVSNITGMKTSDFALIAPSRSAQNTGVTAPDRIKGVGIILQSEEINGYMLDLLELEGDSKQIIKEDFNRGALENKLVRFNEQLEEVATLKLLRDTGKKGFMEKDVTKLISYRIETRDLQRNADIQQVADIEK